MLGKTLKWLEDLALWIGCAALLVMGAIVTASVIGRGAFNAPVPDDLLMAGLLMVCVIILPLSYIERTDGHIVVTVIANLFPVRFQQFLAGFGRVLFGLFLGTMGFMLALKVPAEYGQQLYYDGRLEVPTWPMKMVFAFGVLVFLIRLATNAADNFKMAFGFKPAVQPGTGGTHEL